MTIVKCQVDFDRLTKIAEERCTRWDLVADAYRALQEDGSLELAVRNWIICELARSPLVSSREIGECFLDEQGRPMTSSRVGQIVVRRGSQVVPKTRRVLMRQRLEYLASPKGRRLAQRVMERVAREDLFWLILPRKSRQPARYLNVEAILEALGFPKVSYPLCSEIWQSLIEQGIIAESNLAGIVLYYGLGEKDPRAYLQALYHENHLATIKSVTEKINQRAKELGVLDIGRESLRRYMIDCGIQIKPSGSKAPGWLWSDKK